MSAQPLPTRIEERAGRRLTPAFVGVKLLFSPRLMFLSDLP